MNEDERPYPQVGEPIMDEAARIPDRVFMSFKEGCDVCVAQRGVEQLTEGSDG